MDSKHLIYEIFVEKIVDNFYEMLCKLEQSDSNFAGSPLWKKLQDVDTILQKLMAKSNAPSIQPAKPISTRNESIPSKIKITKEMISTCSDKKRKSPDSCNPVPSHSDDPFERFKLFMRNDIEGNDDSDCDMMSEPVPKENLFKTDYPDECFVKKEEKQEKEVSCEDVSSSLNKSLITSFEEDPYIRKLIPDRSIVQNNGDVNDQNHIRQLNPDKPIVENNGDVNGPNDPYIIKITDDVFKCQLCLINNLPQNNVLAHVNGRQHRNAIIKHEGTGAKLKEAIIPKVKDTPLPVTSLMPVIPDYECTLCKTVINGRENVLQHVNGRQHSRKLENARVNP